jgi:hypothetical protein
LFRVSSISNSFFSPDFQFRTKHRYLLYTVLWCIFLSAIFFSKSDYTDVTVLKVQFNNSCLNFTVSRISFWCNFLSDLISSGSTKFWFITSNGFVSHIIFPSELISALCFSFSFEFRYIFTFSMRFACSNPLNFPICYIFLKCVIPCLTYWGLKALSFG